MVTLNSEGIPFKESQHNLQRKGSSETKIKEIANKSIKNNSRASKAQRNSSYKKKQIVSG